VFCVVVWQRVIGMVCVLCGCVVVWQHVIGMLCVLCGGVAACYRYGVCTVWWCGSVL